MNQKIKQFETYKKLLKAKNFKRNNTGQFTIIAAILIAILTLSIAFSVHQLNLRRQELRYKPAKELVLGITSDLDRCLIQALGIASKKYNETWSQNPKTADNFPAIEVGKSYISKWVHVVTASYSHLSIRMHMETNPGSPDVVFGLLWGQLNGLSSVWTKFELDINAYGFKGWVGQSGKLVWLMLSPHSLTDNNSTLLRFTVLDDYNPVQNLASNYVVIKANVSNSWVQGEILNLEYLGRGIYQVEFTPQISNTSEVRLTVVTPNDNIYVSAYYNPLEPVGWGTLYLSHLHGEHGMESMLVPADLRFTPYYMNPSNPTLNIPNNPGGWSIVNINSPIILSNIKLAPIINGTIWIKPEAGKCHNITIELSFTYNGTTYEIGGCVLLNPNGGTLEGPQPYDFSIYVGEVEGWPLGGSIIPMGSIITLTLKIPPDSGTVNVIYRIENESFIKLC
ncbi:MAG: hypothetical protein QXW17_01680 [Candidatus Bathyarchaeia archaeon]